MPCLSNTTERSSQIAAILARIEVLRPRSTVQADMHEQHASPLDTLMMLAATVMFTTDRSTVDVLLLIERELRQNRRCTIAQAAHRVEAHLLGLGKQQQRRA